MASSRSRSILALFAVAALVALTACGSSGTKSGSSGTSASSTTSSGGKTPTGTPIEVEEILSFPSPGNPAEPEVAASINARFDAVNAAGGVDGHPVKLVECYDQGDPNTSRTCADQAVANPEVVATLFVFSDNDDIIDPIMEKAGMAQIGIDPQGSADPTCDVCFPMDGGGISDTVGLAAELHVFDGAQKIDLEIPEVPVAQAEMADAKNALLAIDPTAKIQEQFVPLTVADYAPYVEASAGNQATALYTGGSQLTDWVKTAHSLGIKMDWGVLGCCISPQNIQQLGSLLNGALVAADTAPPTSNVPGAELYRSEVAQYAPKGTAIDENALYGWMAAKLFTDVAKTIKGSVTRSSLLAAMRNLTDYTGFEGLIAPYTTTKKFTGLNGTAPYLFNVNLVPVKLENGDFQIVSTKYIDPFTGQLVSSGASGTTGASGSSGSGG